MYHKLLQLSMTHYSVCRPPCRTPTGTRGSPTSPIPSVESGSPPALQCLTLALLTANTCEAGEKSVTAPMKAEIYATAALACRLYMPLFSRLCAVSDV